MINGQEEINEAIRVKRDEEIKQREKDEQAKAAALLEKPVAEEDEKRRQVQIEKDHAALKEK
ncbi:MAG: hypothetical protein ACMG6E_04440 [Candidatus Roizmanbacteria bacterium]